MNIPIVFRVLSATQRPSLPKPLNTEEEQLMRVFYEQKIQEVCAAFGFPHKIQVNKFVPTRNQHSVVTYLQTALLFLHNEISSCFAGNSHHIL